MNITKKFTKKELLNLEYYESKSLVSVEETMYDQRRWHTIYTVVFKDNRDGKHYITSVERGSTEMQETEDAGYYDDEYDCVQVEHVDVTVKKWMPVTSDPKDQ